MGPGPERLPAATSVLHQRSPVLPLALPRVAAALPGPCGWVGSLTSAGQRVAVTMPSVPSGPEQFLPG